MGTIRLRPALAALLLLAPGRATAQSASPTATALPAATGNPVPAQALPPSHGGRREVEITPGGAVWRSALLPGWGQRYKGEKKKGWILTGVAAGLLAGSLASYEYSQQAHNAYESLGPGTDPGTFSARYQDEVNAATLSNVMLAMTGLFWAGNVAETAFSPIEPIRIRDAHVKDVFPAFNKFYEVNPIVTVALENRGTQPVTKLKVKFQANEVMDLPAESETVEMLPPGLGKSVAVTAPFNRKIFAVGQGEPKEVQAKLTVEYESGHKRHELTRTATFTVYGRNAIVWDDMRKLSAFVTPRDDGVKTFVGAVATRKLNASTVKTLSTAAAFFDAVSAYGITYVSDPNAPFSYFEGNAEAVDTVNYPFETLLRKTGDCDDLTSLYASLLESAGIATALVDVPGHVFVMFDSGLSPEEMKSYVGGEVGFLPREGSAWVPVEVTAVGKPFTEAWTLGASEVKKWSGLNQFHFVDTVPSQAVFPPSPPDFGAVPGRMAELDSGRLAALVREDSSRLSRSENGAQQRAIAAVKAKKYPPAVEANEIGVIYAKAGRLDEAAKSFEEAKSLDPRLAKAWNNLANIAYLKGDNAGAAKAYQEALAAGGENAGIFVNLANLCYEQGDSAGAKGWFEKAVRIEPGYARQYTDLAALLSPQGSGAKVATGEGGGPGAAKAANTAERDGRSLRWIP